MTSVRVEDVTKDYALGRTTVPALRGVSTHDPRITARAQLVVRLADGRIAA